MKKFIITFIFLTFMGFIFHPQEANCQDSFIPLDSISNFAAVGIGMAPDYEGSDDYMFGALPFGKFRFKGHQQYIMVSGLEIMANILDHPWLRLGPSLAYKLKRDDSVEDKVVKKMKEIDGTPEAGGFIGLEFVSDQTPRKRLIMDVDFLTDIGNEHKGYTILGSVRAWYPIAMMFDVGLSLDAEYASDNYMKTYFSVDKEDSARTGLPIFDAESGLKDIRVTPVVVMHLSVNWHVAAGVQYRRLLSDAKDSPVVDMRGSANQWIGGIGLAYSW